MVTAINEENVFAKFLDKQIRQDALISFFKARFPGYSFSLISEQNVRNIDGKITKSNITIKANKYLQTEFYYEIILSFDYKKTLDAYSLVQCSKCYSRTLDE
jgi:hypothetical protein